MDKSQDYIAHWGIKGMKWGVRKDEEQDKLSDEVLINRDNNKTKIKRDKLKYASQKSIKQKNDRMQNAQANREHIERLKTLALVGSAITAASKAWSVYQKRKAASGKPPKTVINNFPQTEIFETTNVSAEFIPHDTTENVMDAIDIIRHSGIKGMKWGIRNYQNEDGTLTEAGKARYRDTANGPVELDARTMTNDELDYANNRFAKEKTYNSNTGNESRSPGFKKNLAEKTIISGAGTFALTAASSLVYNLYGKNREYFENEKGEINKGLLAKRVLTNAGIAAGIASVTAFTSATGKANSVSSYAPLDQYNTPIINPDKDKKVNKK